VPDALFMLDKTKLNQGLTAIVNDQPNQIPLSFFTMSVLLIFVQPTYPAADDIPGLGF